MSQYYTLGAQLPTLKQGEYHSHQLTSSHFAKMLLEQATSGDKKLVQLALLRNDNRLLLQLLRGEEPSEGEDKEVVIGREKLQHLIDATHNSQELGLYTAPELSEYGYPTIKKSDYPQYLIDFVAFYLKSQREEVAQIYFYDDLLLIEYAKYIQEKGNSFLRYWLSVELDIVATFAALSAEKYGLDPKLYILGDREIHQALIANDWHTIAALPMGEVAIAMKQIAEEQNLAVREQKIDSYKWELLDEATFADTFSINAMLAYLLKLQLLERWEKLDKVQGEQHFRDIVASLNENFKEEMDTFKKTLKHQARKKRMRQDNDNKA